jgi:hypothetical protein
MIVFQLFPAIRFICTIMHSACSHMLKKTSSCPLGQEDAIVHAVLSEGRWETPLFPYFFYTGTLSEP